MRRLGNQEEEKAQKVQPDLRYELETASISILDNIGNYDRPAVKNYNQLTINWKVWNETGQDKEIPLCFSNREKSNR